MCLFRNHRSPIAHPLVVVVNSHDRINAIHRFAYISAIILNLRSAKVCLPASARAVKTIVVPAAQIINKRMMALPMPVRCTNLVIRYWWSSSRFVGIAQKSTRLHQKLCSSPKLSPKKPTRSHDSYLAPSGCSFPFRRASRLCPCFISRRYIIPPNRNSNRPHRPRLARACRALPAEVTRTCRSGRDSAVPVESTRHQTPL